MSDDIKKLINRGFFNPISELVPDELVYFIEKYNMHYHIQNNIFIHYEDDEDDLVFEAFEWLRNLYDKMHQENKKYIWASSNTINTSLLKELMQELYNFVKNNSKPNGISNKTYEIILSNLLKPEGNLRAYRRQYIYILCNKHINKTLSFYEYRSFFRQNFILPYKLKLK